MNLACYNLARLIASGSFCVGSLGCSTHTVVCLHGHSSTNVCGLFSFCFLISLVKVSRTMWKKGVRKPPFCVCSIRGKGPGSDAGFEPFLDLRGSFLVLVCRESLIKNGV